MATWFNTTFAALRNRHFRVLWAGSLFSFVAFFMSTVVQSVVAFDLSGNNSAVGAVVFAQGLAQFILGPVGGAMADRVSRRTMLFACQSVITVAFLGLALLDGADRITILFLAAGSFVIGSAFSFLGPSRQAFAIDVVDPQQRGNAMALTQVALNGSRILGPLFAGIFLAIAFLGSAGAYVAMAALYVGAIATTAMLPHSAATRGVPRSVLADIAVGLRYVWSDPGLRVLVLSFVLVIMFGFPYVSVLPGMVENELNRGTESVTILYGVTALGGLVASLAVASLADSPRAGVIYRLMGLGFGLSLGLCAIAPSFLLLTFAMLVLGVASGGFQTLNGALVAHVTEPAYIGRVMSLTFLAFAGFGLVALPIGILADAVGERATLALMGAAVSVIIGVVTLLPAGARAVPAEERAG